MMVILISLDPILNYLRKDNETIGHIIFDCTALTDKMLRLFKAQAPTDLLQDDLISGLLKLIKIDDFSSTLKPRGLAEQ